MNLFFQKSGHFSLNLQNGQGRPHPPPPSNYAPWYNDIVKDSYDLIKHLHQRLI